MYSSIAKTSWPSLCVTFALFTLYTKTIKTYAKTSVAIVLPMNDEDKKRKRPAVVEEPLKRQRGIQQYFATPSDTNE